jgi:hypothetical protein
MPWWCFLAHCVAENVNVSGCQLTVMIELELSAELVARYDKAREPRHGPDKPPPMYCDPGSAHFH